MSLKDVQWDWVAMAALAVPPSEWTEVTFADVEDILRKWDCLTAQRLNDQQDFGAWALDVLWTEMLIRAGILLPEKQYVPVGNKLYRYAILDMEPSRPQRFTGNELPDFYGNHWETAATCFLLYEPVPRWDLFRGIMARIMRASEEFGEDIAGKRVGMGVARSSVPVDPTERIGARGGGQVSAGVSLASGVRESAGSGTRCWRGSCPRGRRVAKLPAPIDRLRVSSSQGAPRTGAARHIEAAVRTDQAIAVPAPLPSWFAGSGGGAGQGEAGDSGAPEGSAIGGSTQGLLGDPSAGRRDAAGERLRGSGCHSTRCTHTRAASGRGCHIRRRIRGSASMGRGLGAWSSDGGRFVVVRRR